VKIPLLENSKKKNGFEVEDDQILFWSLICKNYNLVFKILENYDLTPETYSEILGKTDFGIKYDEIQFSH